MVAVSFAAMAGVAKAVVAVAVVLVAVVAPGVGTAAVAVVDLGACGASGSHRSCASVCGELDALRSKSKIQFVSVDTLGAVSGVLVLDKE